MDALTVAVVCLLTSRVWWLLARDAWPFGGPRDRLEDTAAERGGWLAHFYDGLVCPFCASIWWGMALSAAAWHLTDVHGSWLWWIPAVGMVASLVTALFALVVERLSE